MFEHKDPNEKRLPSSVVHLFWDSPASILAEKLPASQSLPGPELVGVLSAVKAKMTVQLLFDKLLLLTADELSSNSLIVVNGSFAVLGIAELLGTCGVTRQ